jgi:hypothetical protein
MSQSITGRTLVHSQLDDGLTEPAFRPRSNNFSLELADAHISKRNSILVLRLCTAFKYVSIVAVDAAENIKEEASDNNSLNGYNDSKISSEWLKRVFNPQPRELANRHPRVPICDGFGTHKTLEVLECCLNCAHRTRGTSGLT